MVFQPLLGLRERVPARTIPARINFLESFMMLRLAFVHQVQAFNWSSGKGAFSGGGASGFTCSNALSVRGKVSWRKTEPGTETA